MHQTKETIIAGFEAQRGRFEAFCRAVTSFLEQFAEGSARSVGETLRDILCADIDEILTHPEKIEPCKCVDCNPTIEHLVDAQERNAAIRQQIEGIQQLSLAGSLPPGLAETTLPLIQHQLRESDKWVAEIQRRIESLAAEKV